MVNNPNYGWTKSIYDQARDIVKCLGGGEKAFNLIVETAASETALGKIFDNTIYAGMGICQFDKLPFYRIKERSMRFRALIKKELGVDIELIEWEHLRYNSFLSLLFCRLYYMAIKKPIPQTLEGRSKYWKKYYNSYLGKGTPKHYRKMVQMFVDTKQSYMV